MISKQELDKELSQIPPFAASLMRLTDIILSGNYTIDDVCNVVKLDQALTIDVIGYSNSAESGSIKSISSVQEALVRMGGARIMRFLLAKWFRGSVAASMGSSADSSLFWKHGVNAAVATDVLAEEIPSLRHPAAFTASLVHDVGWVPFASWSQHHHQDFNWKLLRNEGNQKELARYGFTHMEVGALILEKWRFSKETVEAVRSHSEPGSGPHPLTDSIRFANVICHHLEEKAPPPVSEIQLALMKRYCVSDFQFALMVDISREAVAKTMEEFGVSG
jgi:HD-like signal output (HDOD) protein